MIEDEQFFDDEQRPVGVSWPDVYGDEPDTATGGLEIEDVISLFLVGSKGQRDTSTRVEVLGYLMPGVRGRAANLRELGRRIGCSHETARRKCDKVLACFPKEFPGLREKLRQAHH
jgi:hypothetical protein